MDLMTAYKEAREVAQVISTPRNEEDFHEIYKRATEMASTTDVDPVKKRVKKIGSKTGTTPHSQ